MSGTTELEFADPRKINHPDVCDLEDGDVVRIGEATFIFRAVIFDGDELGRRGFIEIRPRKRLTAVVNKAEEL